MSDFEFYSVDRTIRPTIYAYSDNNYPDLLKVGYTERTPEVRIKEGYGVTKPGEIPAKLQYTESAMRSDGSVFSDKEVHKMLQDMHCPVVAGEWYRCTVNDVKRAIYAVKNRLSTATERILNFKMRPEQKAAVEKTKNYYKQIEEDSNITSAPKFLWNCKMRFGKTFASYELAKELDFKRILILTFKPAVKTAWKDDLNGHVDFDGWQFLSQPNQRDSISNSLDIQYENADKAKPIVCFGSFQDLLGLGPDGRIKTHNEWIHTTVWDLIIFDEYHFGAWKNRAKDLFEKEDEEKELEKEESTQLQKKGSSIDIGIIRDIDSEIDESFLPISTTHYLFLSGTPFRAINSGEFIEEQIYSWTYSNEQNAKANWNNQAGDNPYKSLPRMVMMTYKLPESIRKIAMQGEFNEFDLNAFFATTGNKNNAEFIHKQYIQNWLDLIRGEWMESSIESLRSGHTAPFPYSDIKLRQALQHTLWFLPSVNSCYAMKKLLKEKQNSFYHDYEIVVCAGSEAGQGAEAIKKVETAMSNPLETKTITLSCGKLTTGVTIKPWTGIFMLRNLKQPETYFQAAFRVQSPWTIGNKIVKQECYVFDFAPNRTLRQLSEYSCRLNIKEPNPEKKVAEFIKFLPVLSYEGNVMREISATDILDIAMAGTSATLLARRWESALLVNVDNATLSRLLANEQAMKALMSIESFRNLNSEIETIINKSKEVKDAKRAGKDKNGTRNERDRITDDEREYKSKRKQIQEKLIKFATRIPIFMYLTDFREISLKDVITNLEPKLFKKVTGLNVSDFELLSSIGLFNEALMNDSIYKFRRYEEASLEYTGINKHLGQDIGGFSTVLKNSEFKELYGTNMPLLKIGDIVEVKGEGDGIITSIKSEKITIENKKGIKKNYIYPEALKNNTIKIKNPNKTTT